MSRRPGDLRELYQEVIFDHNRSPRNFRALDDADHRADGHNPLCGDQLTRVPAGRATDRDRDVELRRPRLRHLHRVGVADDRGGQGQAGRRGRGAVSRLPAMLTEAPARAPVATSASSKCSPACANFPARVKCATLAWHTLHNALTGAGRNGKDGMR